MQIKSFKFTLRELGGALGDLGTLLPLMIALILINGLNLTMVLVVVGLCYIGSGLYYRLPTPVQPLKVASAIAISLGLSAGTIGAAGIIMAAIMLLLVSTNLVTHLVKLFPAAVVRGIQLSVGIILLKKGLSFAFSDKTFIGGSSQTPDISITIIPLGVLLALFGILLFFIFRKSRFPASLAIILFGLGFGVLFKSSFGLESLGPTVGDVGINIPSGAEFWVALTVLVIPQLPLTLGNAVVGTSQAANVYFGEKSHRMKPRTLASSMGLANIAAGLFGAMPICHGSGGLTAHYKLGARTGGANIMIGALFLVLGLGLGAAALSVITLIPVAVLGVLLGVVGVYHALLARDLRGWGTIAVAVTVALVTIITGDLAIGFGAGILLHYIGRILDCQRLRPWILRLRHDMVWLLSNHYVKIIMGYRPMPKLRSWAVLLNDKVHSEYNAAG